MTRAFALKCAAAATSLLLLGCGGTTTSISNPAAPDTTASVAPGAASATPTPAAGCPPSAGNVPTLVPAAGGQFALTITAASSCEWTAQIDVDWAQLVPASGRGSNSATLTVTRNATPDGRSLDLLVSGQRYHVTQSSGCTFTIAPPSVSVGAEGGSTELKLTTIAGCEWTARASEAWLQVVSPAGSGSASVGLSIAANPGDTRHATLTIAGLHIVVTQEGRR